MERVRYIKKVDTGNPLRVYVEGQTIDIILPRNKVDISSFKLYYDVEIDPVYKYTALAPVNAFVPNVAPLIEYKDAANATVANTGGPYAEVYDMNYRNPVLDSLVPFEDVPGVPIPYVSDFIMTRGPLLPRQPAINPNTGSFLTVEASRTPFYDPPLPSIDPATRTRVMNLDDTPAFHPALPQLDENGDQLIGAGDELLFHEPEPAYVPGSGTPFLNPDGSPVMLPAQPKRDPITNEILMDPDSGDIVYLDAVAPIIPIIDEHGKPIPTALNPTPNILMKINTAFVYGPPPLITAYDKFGDPIPNAPPHVVMRPDPAFVPDVPPVTLPVARLGAPEVYLKRFMPRLASSIIDTLTIRRNGTVIQEIKDYNILYSILNDGLKEEDDLSGDKVDTLNYTKVGADNKPVKVCDFTNSTSPDAREPIKYRYFIKDFMGLIGESSNSNIDAGKNEIQISIKLASKYITYKGIDIHNIDHTDRRNIADRSNEIDYQYKISNVFGNIDVLPERTNVPDVITFKHYKTVKGTQVDNKETCMTHKHKGKLEYILSTFVVGGNHDTGLQLQQCNQDAVLFGKPLKKNYGDLRDFVRTPVSSQHVSVKMIKDLTTENNLDNSLYFARQALNVRASQYTLNGQDLTPRMDMSQIYGEAKQFFDGQMTRVRSLSSFESEFFVFPVIISQDDEKYVSEIEWRCYEGNNREYATSYENKGKVYPIMFFVNHQKIYM